MPKRNRSKINDEKINQREIPTKKIKEKCRQREMPTLLSSIKMLLIEHWGLGR